MADDGLLDLTQPWDRDELILNGRQAAARITSNITAASIERTIDGPSVLTVEIADAGYWLMRESGVIGTTKASWKHVTTTIRGLAFTLSELEKTEDGFTLTFYDTSAAKLKDKLGAWKTTRNKMTRADAAWALCIKAGVPFAVHPDVNARQPVESFTKDEQQQINDAKASAEAQGKTRQQISRGSLNGKNITVQGKAADREQLRNIERVLSVAESLGAGVKAKMALLEAIIVESWCRNLSGGDASSVGILQLLSSHLGGSTSTDGGRRDVELVAKLFLTEGFTGIGGAMKLAKQFPERSAGEIAQLVQGSAHPDRYDQWAGEASKMLKVRSGSEDPESESDLASLTGTPDRVRFRRYEFRVERSESYFAALVRWAEEVAWRFFVINGIVWFVSDLTLAQATPSMVIAENDTGIDRVLWSMTRRGTVDTVTVNARLKAWVALPGQVVVIEGEGIPVDGRWLVQSIERNILDSSGAATITLTRPQKPKPEPKATFQIEAGTDPNTASDTGVGEKSAVAKAYAKAKSIGRQGYSYSYGGGHDADFSAPYDCSGFVSAVLHFADLGVDSPLDTVALGQWGKPGEGAYLTVWVKPFSGMNGHTFLVFDGKITDSGKREIYEAGGTSGAKTGFRTDRSFDGFHPRHFKDT